MVELYGPSGCGKSTLALQIVAHLQRDGLACAWIDADRTFDPAYAASLGAEVDRIPLAQPDSAEEGLEVARALAVSGAIDLVIVDSAAALVPRLELEAGIGYYSKGCTAACWRRDCAICDGHWRAPARAWCFSIRCATVRRADPAKPARAGRRSSFSPRFASLWCRRGKAAMLASAEKQGRGAGLGARTGVGAGLGIRGKPVKWGFQDQLRKKPAENQGFFGVLPFTSRCASPYD